MSDVLNVKISRVQLKDTEEFAAHSIRQLGELNDDGSFAHPFSPDHIWNQESYAEKLAIKWTLPELTPHWEIAWKAEVDGKIIGHCALRTPSLVASWHRVKLSMGIEAPYRGNGNGRALLATAVLWARTQARLEWIDLEVFESNQRAIQLYKRFGFDEVGMLPDAYRIKGVSVSNIYMSLKIK